MGGAAKDQISAGKKKAFKVKAGLFIIFECFLYVYLKKHHTRRPTSQSVSQPVSQSVGQSVNLHLTRLVHCCRILPEEQLDEPTEAEHEEEVPGEGGHVGNIECREVDAAVEHRLEAVGQRKGHLERRSVAQCEDFEGLGRSKNHRQTFTRTKPWKN